MQCQFKEQHIHMCFMLMPEWQAVKRLGNVSFYPTGHVHAPMLDQIYTYFYRP